MGDFKRHECKRCGFDYRLPFDEDTDLPDFIEYLSYSLGLCSDCLCELVSWRTEREHTGREFVRESLEVHSVLKEILDLKEEVKLLKEEVESLRKYLFYH